VSSDRVIERLAIVNRGEAAMRCVRAVKALRALEGSNLRAIALFTDADRDAPFVRQADASYRLPSPRGEVAAYLDHDLLLATLSAANADAVWPGWGFVAEDPVFADRLDAAGIRFLGPSGAAMRLLGDKIAAKQLAERVGVPVSPWTGDAVEDEAVATLHAERIGYPLVVKAAAGGGGRGIRVVERPSELADAFRSAGSEARSAFGDGRLFLERKIVGGRHVEVQIARDAHGHAIALGCRDCSVQRRHQKVIEEAPPPGLAPQLRAQLVAAATRLADGVGYVGVGTVEYLVAGESFFFLEVNPRLQVEHGVTETLTGVDLVQLQIRIAREESIAGVVVAERGAAIEARVCAEDPAAGFLPTPGRVARFDPALGPRVRVDTGVVAGNVVPAAFDSLIAKVIASGDTRDEARARLVSALRDFDLVIEGGATNKGWLIDLLETPALRTGGVDTGWLDRASAAGTVAGSAYALESLLAAAIIAYQRRRRDARRNFFADPSNASPGRVPPSLGQEIELSHVGTRYALEVFALGGWRYRVRLDEREVLVTLREGDAHVALLTLGDHTLGDRTLRVLHDETELGARVEVEGHAHTFGWQTIGEVHAVTPAMVAALHVAPGDTVVAGQALGLLEAMKMEIGFAAPVAGVVTDVRVRPGQSVVAGDVLLVIDPSSEARDQAPPATRLALPSDAASCADEPASALSEMLRLEIRGVLLGYDADPARVAQLLRRLDVASATADDAPAASLAELAAEVVLFADVEQPFERTLRLAAGGRAEPSSYARLRVYLRRVRAAGAGLDEDFLALLRRALAHYGVADLTHDDALERALLRLFAAQQSRATRRRLLRGLLDALVKAARAGVVLGGDAALETALARIAAMRDVVGDELADAAIETATVLFVEPKVARQLDAANAALEETLRSVEAGAEHLASAALRDLAEAPRAAFERVVALLAADDPRRRTLALAACLHRHLPPGIAAVDAATAPSGRVTVVARLDDGSSVLACASDPAEIAQAAAELSVVAREAATPRPTALAIVVLGAPGHDAGGDDPCVAALDASDVRALPLTVTWIVRGGPDLHWTFVPDPETGYRRDASLHDVHPATAARIGLDRLCDFALERLAAPDDVYCFHGTSRSMPEDERVFVLAEVRARATSRGGDLDEQRAAFERTFQETARTLRSALALRDPQRRLQWNRISVALRPAVAIDTPTLNAITAGLAPATHRLGIERVLVRLGLLDAEHPDAPPSDVELVVTNVTGRHLDVAARTPRRSPVVPATRYDRKVVEAKRRHLVYPYEILRLLAGGDGAELPRSTFEEYDLDPASAVPHAILVSGRAPGENRCAIVLGVIRTPTEKVPEGMRRVLVLSDPTVGMGSLAAPECDRICAAIDLAEDLGVPVEWVPISSGARIAMDSGTENLDATARVVKRIVTFTARGGVINVIVYGTNVGAQSYWNALATMLMHTRGALIMTGQAAMVLTGRKALEASGSVAAEDEVGIGGFEHVMGPNGEAHYYASDLVDAYRTLYEHYRFAYVVPGERAPRPAASADPLDRMPTASPYDESTDFATVGDIFDDATNPGRKRPFAMRPVLRALIDQDGRRPGFLERWGAWVGAETAIVWDAHLGGTPVCLIGIESQSVPRDGYRPLDGPGTWTGGTLFPQSSKKIARALNAASGVRPVVMLANLSGFDGSPESMRKLQLEYGAEIARAVVGFDGPLLFLVVSRYHGGAYVVFSKALNDGLHAAALEGSYASVIGGGAAASVVFAREVRLRALRAPEVEAAQRALRAAPSRATQDAYDRALEAALLANRAELASEFDAVHSVARARDVGSLDAIVAPSTMRSYLIQRLRTAA